MHKYNNPIINIMLKLPYIFYGRDGELEVVNDAPREKFELLLKLALSEQVNIRFIMRNTKCPVSGKHLHRNGTDDPFLNKNLYVKTQNYCHKKCNVYRSTHLYKYKKKYHNYTKEITEDGLDSDFIDYKSYYSKHGHLYRQFEIMIPVSTIYSHDKKTFEEYYNHIYKLQQETLDKLNIKPSGVYSYDEQYIFINKKLYMRMTIIDCENKIIIGEQLVCFDDFDDDTIKKFLEEQLEGLPLKAIVTDGRTSYKSIIESLGAIHHRCLFHLMQNLMKPLQRKLNQLNNANNKKEEKIRTNENKIEEIKKKYKGKTGRTSKDDKERIKDNQKRNKLENNNKELNKKIKENSDQIKELEYNKERIQNIFNVDTKKDAKRRFNTIYNSKDSLPPIIQRFLERMNKNLEILINHIEDEDIPTTNNIVENYYRTTLPGKHKRIYRTLEGAERRIKEQQLRWTHRIVLDQKDKPLNIKTTYQHLKPKPKIPPLTITQIKQPITTK